MYGIGLKSEPNSIQKYTSKVEKKYQNVTTIFSLLILEPLDLAKWTTQIS